MVSSGPAPAAGRWARPPATEGKGEHKKKYAMLPSIDHHSNQPELEFYKAVLNHSPHWGLCSS
jgi:hypothetical protein